MGGVNLIGRVSPVTWGESPPMGEATPESRGGGTGKKMLEGIKRLQRVVMIIKLLVDQVNYWKGSNIKR